MVGEVVTPIVEEEGEDMEAEGETAVGVEEEDTEV